MRGLVDERSSCCRPHGLIDNKPRMAEVSQIPVQAKLICDVLLFDFVIHDWQSLVPYQCQVL